MGVVIHELETDIVESDHRGSTSGDGGGEAYVSATRQEQKLTALLELAQERKARLAVD